MFETRIRKIGDLTVVALSEELLAKMGVAAGDTLYAVSREDGGLSLLPYDPELTAALEAAEIVMEENHDLLRALA